MYSKNVRRSIVRRLRRGEDINVLCKIYSISKTSIYRWDKELGNDDAYTSMMNKLKNIDNKVSDNNMSTVDFDILTKIDYYNLTQMISGFDIIDKFIYRAAYYDINHLNEGKKLLQDVLINYLKQHEKDNSVIYKIIIKLILRLDTDKKTMFDGTFYLRLLKDNASVKDSYTSVRR